MATKKIKRKIRNRIKKTSLTVIALLLIALAGFLAYTYADDLLDWREPEETTLQHTTEAPDEPAQTSEPVLFHIIDVGQGDAILVTTEWGNMLIDTSLSGERDKLISYLDAMKITEFEYVVFTHPDGDHIGNADYIIQNYDIGTIFMPNIDKTTKTYERMLDAIEEKQVYTILIGEEDYCKQSGYAFMLGSLKNTIIAPNEDYGDDANEMSIVIKSEYGETSIMLTGDAEQESEADILEKWGEEFLDCDVLKVGHHGSYTSTTQEFLDAVSPSIAVVSCGLDNKYGHPHKETMDKLNAAGIAVYRTDIHGTVVLKTDGEIFTVVE